MYAIPFLDIPPLRSAAGRVRLPGSKSISNRVLLLAGLAAGTTAVHDLLDSDDTRVMLAALEALGCGLRRDGAVLHVTGIGGVLMNKQAKLFLGNAGTAMRPLTAALAVFATLQGGEFDLSGVPRMHERPIGDLVDALRQLGCPVQYQGNAGYPPLRIGNGRPAPVSAHEPVRVRGDVSSQFLTALLLALPLATAERAITIAVDGELISKPYIDITLNLLARFGIVVERDAADPYASFTLPRGSQYRSPGDIHVEADASSASYFVALGALAGIDAPVRIEGVGLDSIQGDIRFVDAARAMGAQVDGGAGWLEVRRGAWPLKAIDARLQPHPRRRDDAGRHGAVRRRHHAPDQHRQLAREGDRPHRRDGRRAAQDGRHGRRRRRLHRGHAAGVALALAVRGHPHLRRPPHGHVPVAGRVQPAGRRQPAARCASSTRSASPRPSPTISRRCSPWRRSTRPTCR